MADETTDVALPPARVEEMIRAGEAELLDVRRQHEWDAGRIPGARHVEVNELPERAAELASGKSLVIYCHGGSRSAMAAEALRTAGFDAHSLEGGIDAWAADARALEPEGGHVAESGEAAEILRERGRYVPFPEE
ncbi:MAG: rhodanese-like domain-containing protein [Solirubrobacterales bacterium]